MPYTESGSIHNDPTFPDSFFGTNVLLDRLDESLPQTVLELVGPDAPVPCVVELRHLGGALARPPAVPSAVGHRDAQAAARVLTPLGGADLDTTRRVHDRFYQALRPWTVGRTLNFIYGHEATVEQVREAYDPDAYRRLQELKAVHDPGNLFRCNHNIPPLTR
jgi:Berberine and berberine like